MSALLLSVGGLLLSVLAFTFGRSVAESEKILSEKRRIYEEFLRKCPLPNDAYEVLEGQSADARNRLFCSLHPVVSLYASPIVSISIGRYVEAFGRADAVLTPHSPPLHEAFKCAAKAHNDMILEMRRDALAWSAFGYRGPTRLPDDALERAKESAL